MCPVSVDHNGNRDGFERELVVVHTSDLHLGSWGKRDLADLRAVLDTAARVAAHALILAGDIFDHNRLPLSLIDGAAHMLADSRLRTVILPGNHDPATPDSVYRRGGLADPPNVHVLGVTCDERAVFSELNLEVCGKPHADYVDMEPLLRPAQRAARYQILVAHGHWATGDHDLHRSWLIFDDELAATGADYVALGHWDLAQPAGDGRVPAYYSGSPHHSGTVNVVRLSDGAVDVTRAPVRQPTA